MHGGDSPIALKQRIRWMLAAGCFAALVLTPLDLERIVRPFVDRSQIQAEAGVRMDGPWWPDYPRFLNAVRQRTQPGDVILLDFPQRRWMGGYAFAYYRAAYVLTGREVLPLIDEHDQIVRDNIRAARWVALFTAQRQGQLLRR